MKKSIPPRRDFHVSNSNVRTGLNEEKTGAKTISENSVFRFEQ